jgi:hypothetical protein
MICDTLLSSIKCEKQVQYYFYLYFTAAPLAFSLALAFETGNEKIFFLLFSTVFQAITSHGMFDYLRCCRKKTNERSEWFRTILALPFANATLFCLLYLFLPDSTHTILGLTWMFVFWFISKRISTESYKQCHTCVQTATRDA